MSMHNMYDAGDGYGVDTYNVHALRKDTSSAARHEQIASAQLFKNDTFAGALSQ